MRVAIVHYWLLGMRGGEKIVEALCRLLPEAELFTLFYDPGRVSPLIRSKRVHASFLDPARRYYRSLLPLMPVGLESFDLREFDLVISSESGPAKGVIAPSTTRHICYCHTPMRYLWDLYPAYLHEFTGSRWKRAVMAPLANYLRLWDYASAARVDEFIANSENVRRRIWRSYRREARVLYPPVAVKSFYWKPARDYFLMVGELVPYKRLDYAVDFFARRGIPLKIVGEGPAFQALRKLSGSNVEFRGRVPDEELRELYANCRALIVPGEEDFGIVTVEALASGKPVVAFGRGGSLEIVGRDCGVFYQEQTQAALGEALKKFESEADRFQASEIKASVLKFSESNFEAGMRDLLEDRKNEREFAP